jgi:hypothetical protein
MATVLITYDLHKLGQRYDKLRKLIRESFPTRWECLESTFIVVTTLNAAQVRDLCKSALDSNDELIAVGISPSAWASLGLSNDCNAWLKQHVGP